MDNIETFHFNKVYTPRYYLTSLIMVIIAIALLEIICELFGTEADLLALPLRIAVFTTLILCVTVYTLNKKYVNVIKINYTQKVISVSYIKPFKECEVICDFKKFKFEYYNFTIRTLTYKVLKMTFNNNLILKVIQNELSFPLNQLHDLNKKFIQIKKGADGIVDA